MCPIVIGRSSTCGNQAVSNTSRQSAPVPDVPHQYSIHGRHCELNKFCSLVQESKRKQEAVTQLCSLLTAPWNQWTQENLHNLCSSPYLGRMLGQQLQRQLETQQMCQDCCHIKEQGKEKERPLCIGKKASGDRHLVQIWGLWFLTLWLDLQAGGELLSGRLRHVGWCYVSWFHSPSSST